MEHNNLMLTSELHTHAHIPVHNINIFTCMHHIQTNTRKGITTRERMERETKEETSIN